MTAAAGARRTGRFGFGRGPKKVSMDVRKRIGERWYTPYLFIAPHLILFLAFIGYPFFLGIALSLHNSSGSFDGPFVGLRWYQQLFNPGSVQFERFWTTVWNTILFVIMSVPVLVAAGLFLATILNQKIRGRSFFRALYFAPWTLSVAVVALIWWWMFNANAGVLTLATRGLAGDSPAWLSSNPFAWITIVIATLWWTIGFNTIILLAGMQAIPLDLYEAAAIDGASRWQQFRFITIPSLRPVLLLVITLQILASFQLVGQPQLMTGGGPLVETTPVLLHVFNTAFGGRREISLAAAMALVVAAMMLIVSVINFKFFSSERS